MDHKKSSSLFLLYLFLYLMVAIIPLSISYGALYFSIHALKKEVVHSNQASVRLIQQSIDTTVTDLQSTLQNIESHPSLTKHGITSSPLRAVSTLKEMTNYNDCLSNIVLHERNSDRFFSSAGTFFKSDMEIQKFGKDLTNHGYSVDELGDYLDNVSRPIYWPVNDTANPPEYLYLISPMYNTHFYRQKSNSSLSVALIIQQDYLHNLFRSSQTAMEENILLFNEDRELLSMWAPQATPEMISQIRDHLLYEDFFDKERIELNGEVHFIFTLQSEETGFYYVRFLPERIVYEPLFIVRVYSFVILIISLLVSVLLVIYGMKRSYLPLRELSDWIRQKRSHPLFIKNELQTIKNVFIDALTENNKLLQALNNSKKSLIDPLLTALIRGTFNTRESFTTAVDNLGIDFTRTYYAVCCLLIEKTSIKKQTLNIDRILKAVQEDLPSDYQIYVKDLLFADLLILVINCSSNDHVLYQSTISDIKNCLMNIGLHTSIGMGSFYPSYKDVGKSYLESMNALDYRLIYGKECLITPEMCSLNLAENNYPSDLLENLYVALINLDTEKTVSLIQNLKAYVKSNSCSLHAARYICYDMFSILKKTPQFINVSFLYNLSTTMDVTHLTTFDTIDDFFATYQCIVQNYASKPDIHFTNKNTELGQQLEDYINANCFSYDFQINSMATFFSISTTHMRKLFKQHTGIGISDYVNAARIEKATQLLRDTDMSLQEIVYAIGNSDVSAFIKMFKQKIGMTPGQYRFLFKS